MIKSNYTRRGKNQIINRQDVYLDDRLACSMHFEDSQIHLTVHSTGTRWQSDVTIPTNTKDAKKIADKIFQHIGRPNGMDNILAYASLHDEIAVCVEQQLTAAP